MISPKMIYKMSKNKVLRLRLGILEGKLHLWSSIIIIINNVTPNPDPPPPSFQVVLQVELFENMSESLKLRRLQDYK